MLVYSSNVRGSKTKQRAQITESPSGSQFSQNGSVALVEVTGGEWGLARQALPGRGNLLWCFDRRKVWEDLGRGL